MPFFGRILLILCIAGKCLAGISALQAAEGHSLWKKLGHKEASESPESTPVVGVRGLDKSSEALSTSSRDYEAIKRLEKVNATEPELAAFLKAGGLR